MTVLLDDVDVPIRSAEEEPAEPVHARIVEQLIGPDEFADQLDRRGREFFPGANDVIDGEGDHRTFAPLGREDLRVPMIGAKDFDEVTTTRRELEDRPADLRVHAVQPENVTKQRHSRVEVPSSAP